LPECKLSNPRFNPTTSTPLSIRSFPKFVWLRVSGKFGFGSPLPTYACAARKKSLNDVLGRMAAEKKEGQERGQPCLCLYGRSRIAFFRLVLMSSKPPQSIVGCGRCYT
ncbi:hypothetical protein ANCCAN_12833, partial [Ancylostoma caninum]